MHLNARKEEEEEEKALSPARFLCSCIGLSRHAAETNDDVVKLVFMAGRQ